MRQNRIYFHPARHLFSRLYIICSRPTEMKITTNGLEENLINVIKASLSLKIFTVHL